MLEKLIEIGKRLLSESDINRVLTVAIDGAIEMTGAERGMILLFEDGDKISFEVARNLEKADIENPKFEVSRTIINKVKTGCKALCFHNALEDPTLKKSASAVRLKILSVICLPLCHENQIFGVVYLDNRTVLGAFEPETCEFAGQFGDFISVAAYHALEKKRLTNRVTELETELRGKYHFDAIVGHDPKIVEILKLVARVANSEATVLIQGESGTGKELIARALHFNSNRKEKPFIPINCGALPENLLESELFGHVRGAFTGAIKDKPGWFERADDGTILLDEVSEMTPALQVKLLRVLQTGELSRVGSTEIHYCDVRIVAATNRNLQKLVQQGKFREDLYYRLNVVDLKLPPLRERRGDVPLLVQHFLNVYHPGSNKNPKRLSQNAQALLLAYDFPGNIRELENAIQRAVILAETDVIEPHHLPSSIFKRKDDHFSDPHNPGNLTEAKRLAAEKAERAFIQNCLKATHGHISKAAKSAGVDVSNFHKIMKKHGIDPHAFKTPNSEEHTNRTQIEKN